MNLGNDDDNIDNWNNNDDSMIFVFFVVIFCKRFVFVQGWHQDTSLLTLPLLVTHR